MNRYVITGFILCSLYFISCFAQEWVRINPSFDPPGIYNMSLGTFVDEKNGWFVEQFPGRIFHTTDGGENWHQQKDSSDVWCYDIVCTDTLYGCIVGEKILDRTHFLWQTKNGGDSWKEVSIPDTMEGPFCITFFD